MTSRPLWAIVAIPLLLLVGRFVLTSYHMLHGGLIADPVEVALNGLSPQSREQAHVFRVVGNGFREEMFSLPDAPVWKTSNVWFQTIQIQLPPAGWDELQSVDVRIGRRPDVRTFSFPREQILRDWSRRAVGPPDARGKTSEPLCLQMPLGTGALGSRQEVLNQFINWPGDAIALRVTWEESVTGFDLLAAGILVVFCLRRRQGFLDWSRRVLWGTAEEAPPEPAPPRWHSLPWLLGGLLFLAGALVVLESIEPKYFVQDDNFVQFLPVILQSCRSLEEGVFPNWDPYQFGGAPTAAVGVYALTYPPTYVSYGVARHLLGDEYLTLDVFCILHLGLGYLATFWCARAAGLRPLLACLGALSFVLSGYNLIVGRSWYYMTPVVVYAPLLVLAVIRLQQRPPGWRWVLGTGLVIGAFFHAGNAQMWLYALMLCGLAVLLLALLGALPWRRVAAAVPAGFIGLAVAAPLFLPQLVVTADSERLGGWGVGLGSGVHSMFLPYPLVQPGLYDMIGAPREMERGGHLYYSGTLFSAAGLGALCLMLGWFVVCRWPKGTLRPILIRNIWLVCALVAIVLGIGHGAFLWTVLSSMPVMSKFTNPFKFIAFVNLFCVLGGGLVLERQLRLSRRQPLWEGLLALGVAGLLLYHCTQARLSLYSYVDRPYPALPDELSRLLRGEDGQPVQRIWCAAAKRSPVSGYAVSLEHNLPSVYGILATEGYDPLVEASTPNRQAKRHLWEAPVKACRAYGIRWVLVHESTPHPSFGSNPWVEWMERIERKRHLILKDLQAQARPKLEVPNLRVLELSGVAPLAFTDTQSPHALPLQIDGSGLRVEVASLSRDRRVVVNFLWRPEMKAWADGQPVELDEDWWGRMVAYVPAGAQTLQIRYEPPWTDGWQLAAFLALACGLSAWLVRRWELRQGEGHELQGERRGG
jgi:hypothetical protein